MFRAIAITGSALVAMFVAACDDCVDCPASVEFAIRVDHIVFEPVYLEGDSIIVRVNAIIGPNLCWKFDHFDVAEEPTEVLIWVVGSRLFGVSCVRKQSLMRNRRLALVPYPPGRYRLAVVQPDNSLLQYFFSVVDSTQ